MGSAPTKISCAGIRASLRRLLFCGTPSSLKDLSHVAALKLLRVLITQLLRAPVSMVSLSSAWHSEKIAGCEVIRKFGLFAPRSEEHTSELQSRENLVCRLLLEKKK